MLRLYDFEKAFVTKKQKKHQLFTAGVYNKIL